MAPRQRRRVTVSIDANLLNEVDGYVREHAGTDRSQVVDEALRCWYERLVREALRRQRAAAKSPEELAEHAAWKRVREAQLPHLLRKYPPREG